MVERKRALVTGASSGIGRATALALAARGYDLLLSGRRLSVLTEVASAVRDFGVDGVVCDGDLTDPSVIAALAARARRAPGRLDALVMAAAHYAHGPIDDVPAEIFADLLAANLTAPYALVRAMLPPLRSAPLGTIVFVNSTQGYAAGPDVAAYAATKHGLRGLADSLRAELNPQGLRVLSVFGGKTATDLQRRLYAGRGDDFEAAAARMLQSEDVAGLIAASLELPASAEITDIKLRPRQRV